MTTATGHSISVGLRMLYIMALNATGYVAGGTPTAGYSGLQDGSEKAFSLNIPDPRKFTFTGRDRPIGTDYLSALDGMDGNLTLSALNMANAGYLTNTGLITLDEKVLLPIGTDQAGKEPIVAVMLYQQALDPDTQLRYWRSFIFPRVKMIYKPAGMGESPADIEYRMGMSPSKYHLWGTQLNMADDGCLTAQGFEMNTEYEPVPVAWVGNGSADDFLFDTNAPAVNTTKIAVWVDGQKQSSSYLPTYTPSTTGLAFNTPPADKANIFCLYEKE